MKKNALLLLLLSFQTVFVVGFDSDSDEDLNCGKRTSVFLRSAASPSDKFCGKSSAVKPDCSPSGPYESAPDYFEWPDMPNKILSDYPNEQTVRRQWFEFGSKSPVTTVFDFMKNQNQARARLSSSPATQSSPAGSPSRISPSSPEGRISVAPVLKPISMIVGFAPCDPAKSQIVPARRSLQSSRVEPVSSGYQNLDSDSDEPSDCHCC